MSETEVQNTSEETDDEPVYYNPGRLSLVSGIASWVSWFVLAFFVIDTVIQGIGIQSQISSQGLTLSALMTEPTFLSYLFSNFLLPLFTGIALFLLLQAASIGLNALLEVDFNLREDKSK